MKKAIILIFLFLSKSLLANKAIPIQIHTDIINQNNYKSRISSFENLSKLKQLSYINDTFNQIPYKADVLNYKKKDYWATPLEFLNTGSGDCEDYVIIKYFSLLKLGFNKNNMYFVFAKSNRFKAAHLVLVYNDKSSGDFLVLDNNKRVINKMKEREDLGYLFAMNSEGFYSINQERFMKKSEEPQRFKKLMSRIRHF